MDEIYAASEEHGETRSGRSRPPASRPTAGPTRACAGRAACIGPERGAGGGTCRLAATMELACAATRTRFLSRGALKAEQDVQKAADWLLTREGWIRQTGDDVLRHPHQLGVVLVGIGAQHLERGILPDPEAEHERALGLLNRGTMLGRGQHRFRSSVTNRLSDVDDESETRLTSPPASSLSPTRTRRRVLPSGATRRYSREKGRARLRTSSNRCRTTCRSSATTRSNISGVVGSCRRDAVQPTEARRATPPVSGGVELEEQCRFVGERRKK